MASIIDKTFYVDMWNPNYIKTIALQREALGRELRFYITSDSIPVNLTGITVLIYAKKPDNTSIYATCTKITEISGYCSITMDSQFMAVKGNVQCWLKLISSTGNVISPSFNIEVLETPDIDTIVESLNEFSVFQTLTSQITTNTTVIGTISNLLTTAKTNLVAAINELVAFVPTTNIWYPTFAGSTTPGANQYSTMVGRWYKIGKLVHVEFSLTMSVKDSSMAGNLKITDLPFAAVGNPAADIGICSGITMATTYNNQISGVVSGSSIVLYGLSNGSFDNVPCTGIVAGALIQGSADYMTA